jgi:hypothetical protein
MADVETRTYSLDELAELPEPLIDPAQFTGEPIEDQRAGFYSQEEKRGWVLSKQVSW